MDRPHKNQKYFAGGIDNGYGNYKLLIEGHSLISIPAYFSEEKMGAVQGRVRLGDAEFTVGESALRCEKSITKTVDEAGNKIDYALPMFLGALAHLESRKEWYLSLVASIHDEENLSKELTEKLTGTHECVLAGVPSKVTIEVLKVLPEGMGALIDAGEIPTKLTVLDFGNGTTLLSRYKNGVKECHDPEPCGVERLIDLISKEMKALLSGMPGDPHLIRMGLEASNLSYGRSMSFEAIYTKCLSDWYNKYLKKTVKRAKAAHEAGDVVWCIGGGCLLPGFGSQLRKAGFKLRPNPVAANVTGLLAEAKKRALKGMKTNA